MVSPVRTEKQNLVVLHIIDVVGFEKAILQVLQLPIEWRKSMGDMGCAPSICARSREI